MLFALRTCFWALVALAGIPAGRLWLAWERVFPRRIRPAQSRQSLRIAYALTEISGAKPGGAASHKAGFCRGLQAAGHLPTVLVCEAVPGLDRVARDYHLLTPPVSKGFPLTLSVLANNLVFLRQACKVLRLTPPDVVCTRHNQFNYTGAWLSRVFKVPFILEYNSPANWTSPGGFGKEAFLAWLRRIIENTNIRSADRIMVVSSVLKDRLTERGVPADKIVINPNGADAEMFRPDLDGAPVRKRLGLEGKIVVGFAGHHNVNNTWHGTRYLAQAVSRVVAKRPDVQFLFIGDKGVVDLVTPIVEAEGTRSFVTFASSIPHPEMPMHYAACDILVSPHVHMADGSTFFGSPVKIFEYMAMGKGIVASGIGQLAELLENEANALLTRPGDSDEVANAILKLASDQPLRERLGAAVRQTCLQRCTWKHNAERFVGAYYGIVDQREPHPATKVGLAAAGFSRIPTNGE